MNAFDFSGWATKHNLKCSDGRIITKDAFKANSGETVPLVWNHQHNSPDNILGHAKLENREDGVYAYCSFNKTGRAVEAKELVAHGDIKALSIYANQLQHSGTNVVHGVIREVSLVLAGANPGATITDILCHSDDEDATSGVIFTGEQIALAHADEGKEEPTVPEEPTVTSAPEKELEHADADPDENVTIKDVFETLNDKQKTVVYALIAEVIDEERNNNNKTTGGTMKHNAFENETNTQQPTTLSHAEMTAILTDAKKHGSLKDSILAHGITDVELLFPDHKMIQDAPDMISRDMGWVTKFMAGVTKSPFARIKSFHANITEDQARAKGYMKTKLKKDEVFTLLKRTTTPTTIYKKQKLERDDMIDIVDFNVVNWMKTEMRLMLNEEIARAALVGDGRTGGDDDKINETHIVPIWTDKELYTIKKLAPIEAGDTESEKAIKFIETVIRSRKDYKGSGEPTLFTTEDVLTECLLAKDENGRYIYESAAKLASVLRVKEIVTVPVMEGLTREVGGATHELMGIVVNLRDYTIGADKGGAISMFEDFDIDYNAQKYLIETRCSGALLKPYSAIVVEKVNA